MAQITLDLPDPLAAALARVAKDLGSSPETLLRDAAAAIIEDEEDRQARIRAGQADLEAGRSVQHAEIVAWLRSWGTEAERPAPTWRD
jgi:predicted transcriptional regulator